METCTKINSSSISETSKQSNKTAKYITHNITLNIFEAIS